MSGRTRIPWDLWCAEGRVLVLQGFQLGDDKVKHLSPVTPREFHDRSE